MAGHANDVKIC